MRAFEVYLNGKKVCLGGIGNDGVLSAIVTWVSGRRGAELGLTVGGLISPAHEHVRWVDRKLRLGDEIKLKIVDADSVDKPKNRHRIDPAEARRSQKKYVRTMAKQFGWKIQTVH